MNQGDQIDTLASIEKSVKGIVGQKGYAVYKVLSADLFNIVHCLVHWGYTVKISLTNDGFGHALFTVRKCEEDKDLSLTGPAPHAKGKDRTNSYSALLCIFMAAIALIIYKILSK